MDKTDTALPQVTSYQYDYENKLKRIDCPDGTYSEYRYDPFGNRIKKDVNATVTWFVYDLGKVLPDVIGEYDGGGALIAGYTHGPGIDDIVSMRRGDSSYYYFKDGLGTITSLADNTEGVVNTYEYDAFGSVFSKTEPVVNPYGFTGRVLDNESGLMYYRMRYYDPGIGRFITADPIRFQGGINFYTYVKNNPINCIDPDGLRIPGAFKAIGWGLLRISKWVGGKIGETIGEWADSWNPEIVNPPAQQEMDKDTDGDGIDDYYDNDDDNDGIPDDEDDDPKKPNDQPDAPC